MRQVLLPGTDIRCSRFIFGTASLFSVGAERSRYRLLKSAVEQGFTHFDTAPYYGFGTAERTLSRILREHPDVTFTTKVGIYSPGGEAQPDAFVLLRKAAGKLFKKISAPTKTFDLDLAKRALEGSLRRTGRDRIDIYTLHEPDFDEINTDEWQRWLEDCVAVGQVGHFGLASLAERARRFVREAPGLTRFLQVADSLSDNEAKSLASLGQRPQVTYGYVTSARQNGDLRPVETILRGALERNPTGAVIVSTSKAERLPQYARIAGDAA